MVNTVGNVMWLLVVGMRILRLVFASFSIVLQSASFKHNLEPVVEIATFFNGVSISQLCATGSKAHSLSILPRMRTSTGFSSHSSHVTLPTAFIPRFNTLPSFIYSGMYGLPERVKRACIPHRPRNGSGESCTSSVSQRNAWLIEPRCIFLVTLRCVQCKYVRASQINQPTQSLWNHQCPLVMWMAGTPFPVSSSLCSFIMATKGVTTASYHCINTPRFACLGTKNIKQAM